MGRPAVQVPAILVGGIDYRDKDRIVRLLTAQYGRVSALARNARGSRRRFSGALDLGQRIHAMLRPGRGDLWYLDSALPLDSSLLLHDDILALALVAYSCELVAAFAQESSPEPKLFGLLDTFLMVLDQALRQAGAGGQTTHAGSFDLAGNIACLRPALEAKALTFAGLAPVLRACALCDGPLEGRVHFDPRAGGGLHQSCGAGRELDAAFLAELEHCRRTPMARLVGRAFPEGPRWLLARFGEYHLGRPLRSREWLAGLE